MLTEVEVPLAEMLQTKKDGEVTRQWRRKITMAEKVAKSRALREAFSELSGLYSDEEIDHQPSEPAKPILRTGDEVPSDDLDAVTAALEAKHPMMTPAVEEQVRMDLDELAEAELTAAEQGGEPW